MHHDTQVVYEALLAEIAALNVAVIKTMSAVSRLSGDQRAFLDAALEAGLEDMNTTMYAGVPADRYPAFLAMARKRYTDTVRAIRTR
jgi:hypothetical protein